MLKKICMERYLVQGMQMVLNTLSGDNVLDWSKLKEFVDKQLNVT